MPPDLIEQSQLRQLLWSWGVFSLIACLLLVRQSVIFTEAVGNDPTNPAIKQSAWWPVVVWSWFYWPLAFATRPDSLLGERSRWQSERAWRVQGWGARTFWALGPLLLLLHIAVAFHLGHGWSHEAAWQHTKQVGGYGDGIYVNYLFALVWLGDVVWVLAFPTSYCARPRWVSWTIHGFLAFVVFNAAVVFGGRESRMIFFFPVAVLCGAFLLAKVYKWRTGHWPGEDREENTDPPASSTP